MQRHPLAVGGGIELPSGRMLRMTRLQLEQDSGKTNHDDESGDAGPPGEGGGGRCLVDLNRAGVSLIELVFEPDLRSPEEVGDAMRAVVGLLKHAGICDGSMERGSLRCARPLHWALSPACPLAL